MRKYIIQIQQNIELIICIAKSKTKPGEGKESEIHIQFEWVKVLNLVLES